MPRSRRWLLTCLFVPDLLFGAAALADEAPPGVSFEEVLEVLEAEPSVSTVRAWAIAEARVDPESAARLVRDARARGALPMVRVHGRLDRGQGTRWDHLDLQDQRDQDTDLQLDLWMEWDLGDLASGPDVLRAVREVRELLELRQAIVSHLTITYFDRRRLRAEELLAASDESLVRALERRLRLQELDATLDGLTGGRWTAAVRRIEVPPPDEELP